MPDSVDAVLSRLGLARFRGRLFLAVQFVAAVILGVAFGQEASRPRPSQRWGDVPVISALFLGECIRWS
jgi:hypothetical protein